MIRSIGVPEDTVRRIESFNSSIGLQRVETRGTREALSGHVNTEIFLDYRGVPVLSSYRPLRLPDVRWVIMSEIDEAEAFAPVEALKTRMLLLMAVFLAAILGISFVFSRTMTRPIKVLTAKAESLAKGDLGVVIDTSGGDEVSHLARNFDVMRKSLRELIEGLEQKVRERTAELRAIMDSAHDALICMDDSGHVILWNPAAENMFGRSAKDMLGVSLSAIIPERHRGAHEAGIRRLNMNEEPRVAGKTLELTALREDGNEFPIGLTIGTWTIGERRYFTGVIRDITDRKRTEKALAEKEAQLRVALDNMPGGMMLGDRDLNYVLLNSQYSELYEFPDGLVRAGGSFRDEMRYQADRGDLGPGDKDELIEQIVATYQKGEAVSYERAIAGSGRTLQVYVAPTPEGGYVTIVNDITDRKRAEEALQAAHGIIKDQKERMESELNVGHEIQMSFVPDFSSLPDRTEFSICATLEPAREVGGDFYDSYFLDEERFCFCIADVSGKGVPAALFMAMAKTLIKSRAADDRSTASILTHVNDELSVDNQGCMFVTVFAGILNIRSGELLYTNAGHNPPYIRRKDGTLQRLDQCHGPAIAAMEGMVYKEERDTLEPGDLLLLYTDGVTEAMDVDHHLFSEDRLKDLLTDKSIKGVQTAVDHTVAAVRAFEGEAERTDDVTVLALEFHGRPEDALRTD
jgi:PAS domain S-box-containing protein